MPATDPAHAVTLARLQRALADWRRDTADPLLKPENLARLKAEIAAASKSDARENSWLYPYYFFGHEPPPAGPAESQGRKKRKNQ